MADFNISSENFFLLHYRFTEHGMKGTESFSDWSWYFSRSLCSIISPDPFDAIFPFGSYYYTLDIFSLKNSPHSQPLPPPKKKFMLSVGKTELFYNLPAKKLFLTFRLLGILSSVLDIFPKVYFFINMTIIFLLWNVNKISKCS